jgi:hypothetical protein
MIVTGTQVAGWAVGVFGTVLANIITFLLYTAVTSTGWFKGITIRLEHDLDKLDPAAAKKYGGTASPLPAASSYQPALILQQPQVDNDK